jgi:N-acetylneuraminic acid mutarotase
MLNWALQAPFGAFPAPTYDHCAVGLDGKIYVFGGNRNPEGSVPRLSHDMHVFDLETVRFMCNVR